MYSMVSSTGINGPTVDSILCKTTNPSSLISNPKSDIGSKTHCRTDGFSIDSILNKQSENGLISEVNNKCNNKITFQVEHEKDNQESRIDNVLGKHVNISGPMEEEIGRDQNLGKAKIETNQLEEDYNYTQNVSDFKKAVYDLHLHFTRKPLGPYQDFEIYKEMSFEKIYLLIVGIERDEGKR